MIYDRYTCEHIQFRMNFHVNYFILYYYILHYIILHIIIILYYYYLIMLRTKIKNNRKGF